MKRLGPGTYDGVHGFGKTALIDLEPDFTGGYAMQAVNNNAVRALASARARATIPVS